MKRKIRRFREGGDYESSDDYKNLQLAADREAVEYEGEKIAKPLREAAQAAKAEPLKMASFGEAFKEARGRGDKTFEYMGKKYTTEMAGSKKAAEPKTAFQKRADKQTAAREAKPKGPSLMERISQGINNPDNPRIRRERAEMGMKKGGSVKASSASKRADGIAQRGKTRGRMM